MLNSHKSKINIKRSTLFRVFLIKETPSNYLLECNKVKEEREALIKTQKTQSTN